MRGCRRSHCHQTHHGDRRQGSVLPIAVEQKDALHRAWLTTHRDGVSLSLPSFLPRTCKEHSIHRTGIQTCRGQRLHDIMISQSTSTRQNWRHAVPPSDRLHPSPCGQAA